MEHHEPSPVLLPEAKARALYATCRVRLHILRPPYPAIGLGTLRVLRVRERFGETEMTAGYDGYERFPAEPAGAR